MPPRSYSEHDARRNRKCPPLVRYRSWVTRDRPLPLRIGLTPGSIHHNPSNFGLKVRLGVNFPHYFRLPGPEMLVGMSHAKATGACEISTKSVSACHQTQTPHIRSEKMRFAPHRRPTPIHPIEIDVRWAAEASPGSAACAV